MAQRGRRGRPRIVREAVDRGTPELRAKRDVLSTAEPLDLLLEYGKISDTQHRAGLHFRWLYCLVFGAPGVQSRAFDVIGAMPVRSDSPGWRAEREMEYAEVSALLRHYRYFTAVRQLCVFHEVTMLSQATEGLGVLVQWWRLG